jgi:hypothetical protein
MNPGYPVNLIGKKGEVPQRLKPNLVVGPYGTPEGVPFQNITPGAKAPFDAGRLCRPEGLLHPGLAGIADLAGMPDFAGISDSAAITERAL